MAVGSTNISTVKRNQIIEQALRKVRAIKPGEPVSGDMLVGAILAIKEILEEEDNDQTVAKRNLTALASDYLLLSPGRYIYGSSEGLATDIQEVFAVNFRDQNGDDQPIDVVSQGYYDANCSPKNQVGDPQFVN